MRWCTLPGGKWGRQQVFCEAAIQFCLSIKCLFGLALNHQSLGLVESLLRLAQLDWKAPDFSTVSRRQKALNVQLPYRASTGALELLLAQTPPEEPQASGSAWCLRQPCVPRGDRAQRGAQAVIPPRQNGKLRKETFGGGASLRNDALKACARLGRVIWKKCIGYHRRSLVETKEPGPPGHGERGRYGGVAASGVGGGSHSLMFVQKSRIRFMGMEND